MFGDDDAGEGAGEVALEVREYDCTVIAGGEQVVGAGRKADTAHLATVHLQ